MRKGINNIIVDLRELKACGEVLDIGFESGGLIYRALKKGIILCGCDEAALTCDPLEPEDDCNWISGNPGSLPFKDASYDSAAVFFSFSYIMGKHLRNKIISEISRVLKENGRIYIWDFDKSCFLHRVKRLKIMLPGNETAAILKKQPWILSSYDIKGILSMLSQNFVLDKDCSLEGYYYIEGTKKC